MRAAVAGNIPTQSQEEEGCFHNLEMEVQKTPSLQRSYSSSSSASSIPPPALPSRNRRKPPPLVPGYERTSGKTPGAMSSSVSRSNSMDRSYFSKNEMMTLLPASSFTNNLDSFSLLSSGRHTHVFSPTKETLLEHDMKNEGTRVSPQRREVDELRARCAQMEKTMRWWSDCTANWREKWSKVRAERNRYKDEVKRLTLKVAEQQRSHQSTTSHVASRDQCCQTAESGVARLMADNGCKPAAPTSVRLRERSCQTSSLERADAAVNTEAGYDEDLTVTSANFLMLPKFASSTGKSDSVDSGLNPSSLEAQSVVAGQDEEEDRISRFLNDAVSSLAGADQANMLKFRLDEALKTVDVERSDKKSLQFEIESLHQEVSGLECQCDELRLARQESSRELLVTKSNAQEQLRSLQLRLEEQLTKKIKADQIIGHLREELERLQSENAEEWGRRERLETEIQNVERENRKLRSQVDELKDRTKRLTTQTNEQVSTELTRLQTQVDSGSRELLDLRHQHSRLRKTHQEKLEEMGHLQRRADCGEKEVKKLRTRIEELKRDLGRAEDDNDQNANSIRRLQRSNDELMGQAEGYQVQIEHLTSRLRALPPSDILSYRRPSRLILPSQNGFQADQQEEEEEEELEGRPLSSTSEESLPIFDDDFEDEEVDVSQEIETDV